MRHSFIDRYAALDSPLHVLDPRTKLLGFTSLIVAVLWIAPGEDFVFFAYFFLVAILMGISQIPLLYTAGRMLVMIPFVFLAGLGMPWRGGLNLAAFWTLLTRSLLCLIILILLTNTTRFVELLGALRRLGCPRILVLNLGFLYRYFFVLTEEAMRIKQARDCRRVGRTSLRSEWKILGAMLGTLLLRSFERAERMYHAMLSRGYSGDFPVLFPRKFGWQDVGFLSILASFIVVTMRW